MAVTADNLYQSAVEMANQSVDENFLELGSTLRKLVDKDKELFQRLCEKSNLGRRKAYYLVEIDRAIEGRKLPRAKLKKIGWTKTALIAKHLDKWNFEELYAMAEQNHSKKLEALLKGDKAKGNSNHCVLLYFTPKEFKLYQKAVVANGAKRSGRGYQDKEKAMTQVFKKALAAPTTPDTAA